MRNLRNAQHIAIDFAENAFPLTAIAWESDALICASGPTAENATITLRRFSKSAHTFEDGNTLTSWDAPSPTPELSRDRILNLHSFPENDTVCLILEGGDIVLVKQNEEAGEHVIEIVGSVDAGIAAAVWSPDEELLAIVTKAETLLLMTRDFESSTNIALSVDDLRISKHVSVGWGKSDTQFKGRGAKALQDPTVPEHVDAGKLSDLDDRRTAISWRGDGQYVAVNSVLEAPVERRVIRVYSRDGELDSVSEPVDGLEGALSWKPSGELIAGLQRREDRIDVVFFERNGLRHGEFSLRLSLDERKSTAETVALRWNCDSSVLAVCLRDRVQLWTMGNYHYYLKQEICLQTASPYPADVCWHPEIPLRIACFSRQTLQALKYDFVVARGPVRQPHDHGLVAVVDGVQLKLTPLRYGNVPPPMAVEEISLPSPVVDVAISSDGTQIGVLHVDSVSIWRCDYAATPPAAAKFDHSRSLSIPGLPLQALPRQIAFDEEHQPIVLASLANSSKSILVWPSTTPSESIFVSGNYSNVFTAANRNAVFYCDDVGVVTELKDSHTTIMTGKLPKPSQLVEIWQQHDHHILFSLSPGGLLHVQNGQQLLKIPGCTSFIVTPSHLIFTTSQHLLKFVHLHTTNLEIPKDEPEKDERCRNIERGGRLVTVVPSVYSLVLQMPRGNLETIYPRALVLAGIRRALSRQDYKKAFGICRTQRVDMNILHDYDPRQFVNDVELFVKQVKRVEHIDLFLSSLIADDVTKTMYQETLNMSAEQSPNGRVIENITGSGAVNSSSKVNRICDEFLKILASQPSPYLQNIITAHVCKDPPDLKSGLSLLAKLRDQADQDQLDQAVDHICFLADVNQLYETALSLYDLEVALLVAQQSQKDPREYLPYLQSLQDMDHYRQRFTIDNDLKRYSEALNHLHSIGDFEQFKNYTSKHELFHHAIELHRYDNSRLDELMRIFADYLNSRNRFKEAGLAFEYISDHLSAYEAYRAANMWRECIASASLHGMADHKLSKLAQEFAASLEESKDFVASAIIYLDHLQDLESAARLLCRANQFSDAIRHVTTQRRLELLTSIIDPGLIEASATMTELLAEMRSQLAAQVPRLSELRRKKAEDPMAYLDGGGGGGDDADAPDNVSLAPTDASTSGGTFLTRYTNRSTGTLATNATRKTSRNRRREERKRAKGKKGTVYEEEYLVSSIGRLIQRLNDAGGDVERLLEGLVRRGMRERAVAVDDAFQGVSKACRDCMGEVFMPHPSPQPTEDQLNDESAPRPWGGQGVLWDAVTASQQQREAPVLKAFERLSLFGT